MAPVCKLDIEMICPPYVGLSCHTLPVHFQLYVSPLGRLDLCMHLGVHRSHPILSWFFESDKAEKLQSPT